LDPFFGPLQKPAFQPSRHQQVAKMWKRGRFRGRAVFGPVAQGSHFIRNPVEEREIGVKRARAARVEIAVTYNNMLFADAK
jgi:hypothetical protein